MIGSLMSRMGEAQKLSIPQLQQAIHNGTLPAYVGIPLLQEKMQQQKQAQAQAPQGEQAPIAEQVMQEADAVERQRGLAQLQSNLPAEGYAGGGIIAFADGGVADYLDQDNEDDWAKIAQSGATAESDLIDLIARSGGRQVFNPQGSKTESAKSREDNTPVSGSGIREIITNAAKKHGLPAELLQRISGSESNYNPNVKNQSGSSAKGLFQFIDSTWAGMGGKPGEQYNPEINADLGGKYIRQNADYLKRSLGRNPTYGDIYAAHFFGPEGASSLINKADPRARIEEGLATYSSPKMIKKIMEQNPNLKGKTVGDVLSMLNKKTGEGIVSLAKGGVAHFDDGGEARNPYAILNPPDILSGVADYMKGNWEKNKELRNKPDIRNDREVRGMLGRSGPGYQNTPIAGEKVGFDMPDLDQWKAFDAAQKLWEQSQNDKGDKKAEPPVAPTKNEQAPPEAGGAKPPATPSASEGTPSYMDKLQQQLIDDMAAAREEGNMNKYLALMQAGFSMMGGSSPYAAVNFGQGASQGLGAYANLQKATNEDLRKLGAQQIGLYNIGEKAKASAEQNRRIDEIRRAQLGLTGEHQKNLIDLEKEKLTQTKVDQAVRSLERYEKDFIAGLQKEFDVTNPIFQLGKDKPNSPYSQYQSKLNSFYSSPQYMALRSRAYPDVDFSAPTKSGGSLSPEVQSLVDKYK